MKSYLITLFLILALAFSASADTVSTLRPEKSPLSLEQKIQEVEIFNSMLEFIHDLRAIYTQLLNIRHSVPESPTETIAIMDLFNNVNTTILCNSCQSFVKQVRRVPDAKVIRDFVNKMVLAACEKHKSVQVCTEGMETFGDIVYASIVDRFIKPYRVCENLSMCPRTTQKDDLKKYVEEVLKDKPDREILAPTKKSTYTILQISDPHIDLNYVEGSNAYCDLPLCCHADSGTPVDSKHAAGYWGTISHCDLPRRTFDQFMKFVSTRFDIDMILWTGDNIQHNIWEQKKETQLDNTIDLTEDILNYFPDTYVYPMFGNHEAYPCDQFDTNGDESSWITSRLAEMWKIWLDEEAVETFKNKSYYAMVNPEHNVKIIALDTQACDTQDYYLVRDPTDPMHELEWLRKELYDSEKKNQGVFIMGHIPSGDFTCYSEWSSRYRALIDRFSNIVRGQFFGHTHSDEFQIVRSYLDNSPAAVTWIAPSMTTYAIHHPSFRIFEIDSETNIPVNYYQYRLDIDKWNKRTTGDIEWDLAYDALSYYNLEDLSPRSFDRVSESIKANPDVAADYVAAKYGRKKAINALDLRQTMHLYCSTKYSVSEDALMCLGLHAQVNDIMRFAQQLLPGAWYFDQC